MTPSALRARVSAVRRAPHALSCLGTWVNDVRGPRPDRKEPLRSRIRGAIGTERGGAPRSVRALFDSVAWPQAAYRYGYGPSAPPMLQGIFAGVTELASARPSRADLAQLGLLAAAGEGEPAGSLRPEVAEALMDRAHAAGITGVARSFESLVRLPDGTLRFADLSRVRRHRRNSVAFVAARDGDRREFNRRFGTTLLTEATARQRLQQAYDALPPAVRGRSGVDFGSGLRTGPAATLDPDPDRWALVEGPVLAPVVKGRRVLDLGSRTGARARLLLRAGAVEVVGVDPDPALVEFARLNARILQWRDLEPYNAHFVGADIRLLPFETLGRFDVVALFALEGLPDDDLGRLVRKAASMNAVLVVQTHEGGAQSAGATLNLHRLLRDHGYPEVTVHAPPGVASPILIGRPAAPGRPR